MLFLKFLKPSRNYIVLILINRIIMEDSTPPDGNKLIIPLLLGAAAAGAIAFFFYSDEMKELRSQLSEQVAKKWDKLQETVSNKG
jgi:hypothetical protein